jgi:hypothetical protein
MSGLVAVKYKRESMGSPSSSVSSIVVVLIGVDKGFDSSILNFLRMSFM